VVEGEEMRRPLLEDEEQFGRQREPSGRMCESSYKK
jgi:hypothetical protein